jgi:hypothetical protein
MLFPPVVLLDMSTAERLAIARTVWALAPSIPDRDRGRRNCHRSRHRASVGASTPLAPSR